MSGDDFSTQERTMTTEELFELAKSVRESAYAPYSNFLVGCALLTENGEVYTGCNFENLSFGATICAERTAIGTAVASGEIKKLGKKEFISQVVVVTQTESPSPPCGICLQVLSEFCHKGTMIHLANLEKITKSAPLSSFLPHQFESLT
ncbi:MAG: cytidine deaminase [Pseudomonadota bacterium]